MFFLIWLQGTSFHTFSKFGKLLKMLKQLCKPIKQRIFWEIFMIINYNVQLLIISLSILGLDVEAFERLLGPCMEIMKRNIDDYESQLVKIFGSKNNITDIR